MWTPGVTWPATAHLKAMDSADRLMPNRIMARGTKMAAVTANTGEATAAAHGLYLWRIDYAGQFGLAADSAIDSAIIDPSIPGWP